MKFPDLSNLGLRCVCGETIRVESWEDQSDRSRVICMGVHGRQYAQKLSFYELYGPDNDDGGAVRNRLGNGEQALRRECPSRQVPELNTVSTPAYEMAEVRMPNGSVQRRMGRVVRRVPVAIQVPAPAPKPTISSDFGKPPVRKILS